MADKIKDAEDRLLESLLSADAIADDGFSQRIVSRIRRRIWLRRIALPVAILAGGVVAARPALDLFMASSKLLDALPEGVLQAPATLLPLPDVQLGATLVQTVVFAAILLGAGIVGARRLAE